MYLKKFPPNKTTKIHSKIDNIIIIRINKLILYNHITSEIIALGRSNFTNDYDSILCNNNAKKRKKLCRKPYFSQGDEINTLFCSLKRS